MAGERKSIFEPFVRGSTAGPGTPGSGLGLAISRDIARAHGGDITLERSDLGGLKALGVVNSVDDCHKHEFPVH